MNISKPAIIAFLFSGIIAMTGCKSEDTSLPAMPVNARIIDLNNAKATFSEATSTTDTILAKGTQATLTINDILNQIRDNRKNSGQDPIARVAFDHSLFCIVGSGIETGSEVSDGLGNGSGSGTVTFDACEIKNNVVLNGTLSFDYSWKFSGERNDNLSGNIAITRTDTNVTIQLNGLKISEQTNDKTSNYVISVYQYTYDPGIDGFTVQISKPIRGQDFTCGPNAGIVIINGGGNTRLRATYRANRSLTLEVNVNNGDFTELPGSPFYCGI